MSRYCWSAEDLLSHADFLAHRLQKCPPEKIQRKIELFAKSIEESDPTFADWVRRSSQRKRWQNVIDTIRDWVACGDLQAATQVALSFQAERDLIVQRLSERSARGGRKGGSQPKRRTWADALAQHLANETADKDEAWEKIPDGRGELEIENYGDDLQIYRDGNCIICMERGGRERKLARSTFFARYFPPKQ